MGYAFDPAASSVKREVRRIALERLDHALRKLDRALDPNEAVHEARKDIKKLRGLIRLVRPAFKEYRHENVALRDAARLLSGVRDRTAMVEACDRLVAAHGAGDVGAALAALRDHLASERPAARDEIAGRMAEMQAALADVKARATGWKLKKKGFDALEGGLEKTYGRARDAMATAEDTRAPEDFHDWRKRVKYHWYHARLLAPAAPDLMAPHVELASRLSDAIGDHHDLVAFRPRLAEAPLPESDKALVAGLVDREQARLEDAAFAMGRRLLADSPAALTRRWRVWWDNRGA